MFDLRKAQIKSMKVRNEYMTRTQVEWDSIYNSTEEIIEDLKKVHVPKESEIVQIINIYQGYGYIHSFAKQLQNGKSLSDKQMVQCKRLALEIKKASAIADCWS